MANENQIEPGKEKIPVSTYSRSFQEKVRDLTLKTFLLIIIAIVTKIFGLVRMGVTAAVFGANVTTDMFFGVFGSTVVFFEILPTVFNQALVPRYVDLLIKGDREKFNRAVSTSVNYVLIISLIVFLLCSYYAAPIRAIFFHFSPEVAQSTVTKANWLFRLAFVVLFLNVFIGSLTAILYSHDQVVSPSVLNFINGLNVLISILVFHNEFGIFSMVLGYATGGICQILYLAYFVHKTGFKWNPLEFFGEGMFSGFVRPIAPAYVAMAVAQMNIVIDRSFTSRLGEVGMVTCLEYGARMILIILIFSTAFSNAILPKLSLLKSMKQSEEYKTLLVRGILMVLFLILPIAISAMLTARPISTIILYHGEFAKDSKYLYATFNILRIMIIWSLFYLINTQFFNVFYTFKDFRTPLLISSCNVGANVIFNMLFTGLTFGLAIPYIVEWGVIGIATSTAVGIIVSVVLSIIILRGKIGSVIDVSVLKRIAKLGIASFFALGVGYIINRYVFFSQYRGQVSVGLLFSTTQVLVVTLTTTVMFWLMSYWIDRNTVKFIVSMVREFAIRKGRIKNELTGSSLV
ncbi:MAG: lipid II flippase MurJ [bacterium]